MTPLVPDWSSGVRETLEFRTEVLVSRDGTEQRRALRSEPRRRLEFSLLETAGALRAWEAAVFARGPEPLVIPDPLGREALLRGRLSPETSTLRLTDDVGRAGVSFDVTPGDPVAPLGVGLSRTFRGLPLLLVRPNWASGITRSHAEAVERIDYGRGRIAVAASPAPATVTQQMEFLGTRDDDVGAIHDLFLGAKGRRGEFFLPSWSSDLEPLGRLEAGETTLRVHSNPLGDRLEAVAVLHEDGRVTGRGVVSVLGPEGDATLRVDAPWGDTWPLREIERVCWMSRARFAADALQIDWITDGVGRVTPTFHLLVEPAT